MDICILPINNFKVFLIQTEIILCECKAEAPCTHSPTYHETHQTSFFSYSSLRVCACFHAGNRKHRDWNLPCKPAGTIRRNWKPCCRTTRHARHGNFSTKSRKNNSMNNPPRRHKSRLRTPLTPPDHGKEGSRERKGGRGRTELRALRRALRPKDGQRRFAAFFKARRAIFCLTIKRFAPFLLLLHALMENNYKQAINENGISK